MLHKNVKRGYQAIIGLFFLIISHFALEALPQSHVALFFLYPYPASLTSVLRANLLKFQHHSTSEETSYRIQENLSLNETIKHVLFLNTLIDNVLSEWECELKKHPEKRSKIVSDKCALYELIQECQKLWYKTINKKTSEEISCIKIILDVLDTKMSRNLEYEIIHE